jgi:hypothetical protein
MHLTQSLHRNTQQLPDVIATIYGDVPLHTCRPWTKWRAWPRP